MKLDRTAVTEFLRCFRTNACMKWRTRFTKEDLLSWQNILNSRQTAADTKDKFANQGEVLREGISLYLSYQTNGNYATVPQIVGHVIWELHWKSTFSFSEIVNKLRVEVRSSITNCEIYFPIFSEAMHTILKIFSQDGLRKCR